MTYRIYQWGQRVDIYGTNWRLFSISFTEMEWG